MIGEEKWTVKCEGEMCTSNSLCGDQVSPVLWEGGEVCRDEKWVETATCSGVCLLPLWCQRASMGLEESIHLSMSRTYIENPMPSYFWIIL